MKFAINIDKINKTVIFMKKENPKPDYWYLIVWNNGDKFKSKIGDFFTF